MSTAAQTAASTPNTKWRTSDGSAVAAHRSTAHAWMHRQLRGVPLAFQ